VINVVWVTHNKDQDRDMEWDMEWGYHGGYHGGYHEVIMDGGGALLTM
jgi:hypothetical protein